MRYNLIPGTALNVSKICLGSMTWGEQNTEAEGHAQMNFALDKGVNFIDTAEMYAVPGKPETQGHTESIIGTWFAKNKNRDRVILGTKIAGPSPTFKHIRSNLGFSLDALEDAVNKSLTRLQTDYIDLYQLHWPERAVNIFGVRDYNHGPNQQWEDNIGAILDRLEGFVQSGKIRHIAVSNETPFGLMRYMEEHRRGKLKIVSTQNAYSLLQRRDDIALSEVLHMENIGYLAYSPLAFGVLSGKYLDNPTPKGARVTLFPNYNRYSSENAMNATRAYSAIAKQHGISLTQLALAFVNDRPFMTSNIIGATTMEQLEENIGSINVTLSKEILSAIEQVHAANPNPAA